MNSKMNVLFLVLAISCGPRAIPGSLPLPPNEEENQCKPVTTCDIKDTLASLLPLVPGPKGDVGAKGSTGAQGSVGAKGDKGDKGWTGEPGTPGLIGGNGATGPQGLPGRDATANTVVLSAAKTYGPTTSYAGTVTLGSSTVFLPNALKVTLGRQKKGLAFLDFGSIRCTYKGNNHDCDDNDDYNRFGAYVFEFCKTSEGHVVSSLVPGKPFSYSGLVTVSIGDGADTSLTTQVLTFLQVQ